MKKEDLLESIADYKEKIVNCQYKLEILRRNVCSSPIENYPVEMQKYCGETEFVLKKLGEEMVILDYIFNEYADYVKKEGLYNV